MPNKTQGDLRAAYHFDNLQSFLDICCTGLRVLCTERDFGVDFGEVKDGVLSASTEASSALGLREKSRRRRLLRILHHCETAKERATFVPGRLWDIYDKQTENSREPEPSGRQRDQDP